MADKKSNVKGQLSKVHFIGIGGIGMSASARYYKALPSTGSGPSGKWAVSGSDLAASGITRELQKEGVGVKIGHKSGYLSTNGRRPGLVVYSQAIRPDNVELKEARRLQILTLSYPEAIGKLTEKYKTIAIAGAHGKSTTTAIVSLILIKAGFDPTVIIGTNLREFRNRNFRAGRSPSTWFDSAHHESLRANTSYLVLEADEFGRAFLHYSPTVAVVTNIDREHLDTYKNLANIKNAFLKFLARTKSGGTLILNRDDKNLYSLKAGVEKLAKEKNLRLVWYGRYGIGTTIISQLLLNDSKKDKRKNLLSSSYAANKIKKVIRIPGEHNISNAIAAYALGMVLKIPESKVLSAIGSYRGAWRRMEYRGKWQIANSKLYKGRKKSGHSPLAISSLQIYDDYAHHPTEIKATLAAFREKYPHSPIICVFQPHQAERLRLLFKDFISAFNDADVLILLPTYQVAGRERGIKYQVSSIKLSEKLARAIRKREPKKIIFYLKDPKKIKPALLTLLSSPAYSLLATRYSPVVVMMGAGDIVKYTDALIA